MTKLSVIKRATCWACKDTGWVQRGSKIVEGARFSQNYRECDTCSIAFTLKEAPNDT